MSETLHVVVPGPMVLYPGGWIMPGTSRVRPQAGRVGTIRNAGVGEEASSLLVSVVALIDSAGEPLEGVSGGVPFLGAHGPLSEWVVGRGYWDMSEGGELLRAGKLLARATLHVGESLLVDLLVPSGMVVQLSTPGGEDDVVGRTEAELTYEVGG